MLLGITLPNEGWTQDRIKKMYGTSEHDIKFPTPIPVHITYQTAFVDDAGKLQIRDDVYGRDARLLAALKGDERRMADVPMERTQPARAAETRFGRQRDGPDGTSAQSPLSMIRRRMDRGGPTRLPPA